MCCCSSGAAGAWGSGGGPPSRAPAPSQPREQERRLLPRRGRWWSRVPRRGRAHGPRSGTCAGRRRAGPVCVGVLGAAEVRAAMKACRAVHATPVRDASLATVLVEEVATVRRPKKPTDALAPRQLLCPALWRGEPCSTSARRRHTAPCSLLINGPSRPSSRAAAVGFRIGSCTGSATCGRPRGKKTPNARAVRGHSG